MSVDNFGCNDFGALVRVKRKERLVQSGEPVPCRLKNHQALPLRTDLMVPPVDGLDLRENVGARNEALRHEFKRCVISRLAIGEGAVDNSRVGAHWRQRLADFGG